MGFCYLTRLTRVGEFNILLLQQYNHLGGGGVVKHFWKSSVVTNAQQREARFARLEQMCNYY